MGEYSWGVGGVCSAGECAQGVGVGIEYRVSVHNTGKCAWHGISIHKVRVNVHSVSMLKVQVTAQGVGWLCVAWVSVHSMHECGGMCAMHGECTLHG